MTKTTSRTNRIAGLIDLFGAALSASAAVRAHKQPAADDLRRLGIDARTFPTVR